MKLSLTGAWHHDLAVSISCCYPALWLLPNEMVITLGQLCTTIIKHSLNDNACCYAMCTQSFQAEYRILPPACLPAQLSLQAQQQKILTK
jgi:hypothetical protein